MENAPMTIERVDDVILISPHGDLERSLEAHLASLLASLLDTDSHKVIFDLSQVEHIHYGLLLRLINVVWLFRSFDGDLRFAEASPYVKKIFAFVVDDIDRKIFNSLGDAVLSFSEMPVPEQVLH